MSNNMGGAPLLHRIHVCKICGIETSWRKDKLCWTCHSKSPIKDDGIRLEKECGAPPDRWKGWSLKDEHKAKMTHEKKTLAELRANGVMYIAKDGELKRGVYP